MTEERKYDNHENVVGGMSADCDSETANDKESAEVESADKIEKCELKIKSVRGPGREIVVDGKSECGEDDCECDTERIFQSKNIDEDEVEERDTHHSKEEFFVKSCPDTEDEAGLPRVVSEGAGECQAGECRCEGGDAYERV